MSQTDLSLDFSGSEIASQRPAAVASFIRTAQRLLPDPGQRRAAG